MEIKQAFGKALQVCRKHKGLTQEDFSEVSSRTYLSTLERGLKSPTLEKIDEIARVLEIHPLTLLVTAYSLSGGIQELDILFERLKKEADLLK